MTMMEFNQSGGQGQGQSGQGGRGQGQGGRGGRGQGGRGGRGQGGRQSPGGRSGARGGSGAGGMCFCPQCSVSIPHQQGIPCSQVACPQCGGVMVRK
jgi:hypothetical protein